MSGSSNKFPRAGGSVLALAITLGALAGTFLGEPSIGFLAGAAAGLLVVLLIWLKDR